VSKPDIALRTESLHGRVFAWFARSWAAGGSILVHTFNDMTRDERVTAFAVCNARGEASRGGY
jgi:hypothetical protein